MALTPDEVSLAAHLHVRFLGRTWERMLLTMPCHVVRKCEPRGLSSQEQELDEEQKSFWLPARHPGPPKSQLTSLTFLRCVLLLQCPYLAGLGLPTPRFKSFSLLEASVSSVGRSWVLSTSRIQASVLYFKAFSSVDNSNVRGMCVQKCTRNLTSKRKSAKECVNAALV